MGGAEAAAVVVSAEEAAAEEAERGGRGRFVGGLAARLRRALSGSKASSSSSSSSSASSISLRTRLAEELRATAGPPIQRASWLSKLLLNPAGKAWEQRRRLAAAAAVAVAVAAALGSAKSARASRNWSEGRYEWLPTETHKKRVRAESVKRLKERQARLGGLSFLAPVRYGFFSFFFLSFLGNSKREEIKLTFFSLSLVFFFLPILSQTKNKNSTGLLLPPMGLR